MIISQLLNKSIWSVFNIKDTLAHCWVSQVTTWHLGKGLEASSFEVQTSPQSPGSGLASLPSSAPSVPVAGSSLCSISLGNYLLLLANRSGDLGALPVPYRFLCNSLFAVAALPSPLVLSWCLRFLRLSSGTWAWPSSHTLCLHSGCPELQVSSAIVRNAVVFLFFMSLLSGVIVIEESRNTFLPSEISKFCQGAWLPGR